MAGSAAAQDASRTATYGEIRLSAGFTPDPYTVSLQAGGSINGANPAGVLHRLHRLGARL